MENGPANNDSICEHCGENAPAVKMTDVAWAAVKRCLSGGSPTLAAAELVSLKLANKAEAERCISHFRNCVFSWPLDESVKDAIHQIDKAFLGIEKPDHFTNYTHCSECREHDDVFRSKTVKTIRRRDLGNTGYSPTTFLTTVGLAYYLPALARFAVILELSENQDPYVIMLVQKLGGKTGSEFRECCNSAQRDAITRVIKWIAEKDFYNSWNGKDDYTLWTE
jgi:hypothetical protein